MRSGREYGFVRPPGVEEVREYAARHHIDLTVEQSTQLAPVLAGMMGAFDELDELPEPVALPTAPVRRRDPGRPPRPGEDPDNAFIRYCRVEGAAEGPLAGLRAGVKDCIAVSGVPMTNGSRMLPVLVPTEDAVVVERILAAGADIVGKTNLENMAMGTGEGSAYGPALYPGDRRYGAGGSSSGSASAVASGAVDLALGADEAGSVRIPSSHCGVVGMKPTHGLVPTYGLSYMDHTLDHIGPITADVDLNARVLEVMAGPDPRDPQWARRDSVVTPYLEGIHDGVAGITFAVIDEAVAWSADEIVAEFEAGCDRLRTAGATIERVSIPLWTSAWTIENALLTFSGRAMVESGGAGYFHLGRIDEELLAASAAQYRLSAADMAILTQLNLIAAEHLRDHYLGVHFAKAQNLRLELTRMIASALGGDRILLTPTTPRPARRLDPGRHSFVEMIERLTGDSISNTCPLDLSGHPALTVPVGHAATDDVPDGLPVGMQLIGDHFTEAMLYRAGKVASAA